MQQEQLRAELRAAIIRAEKAEHGRAAEKELVDGLCAELRAAVDALRPFEAYAREHHVGIGIDESVDHWLVLGGKVKLTVGDFRKIIPIVAAYEAKHPEGE